MTDNENQEIITIEGGELVKSFDEKIDDLELFIQDNLPLIDLPLVHRFTPGLYIREIRAPAGTLATTFIHKTEHPFVLSQGVVSIFNDGETIHVEAPYTGITKPGTRRVVLVHVDCVWTTFHPTNLTDIDQIEREILGVHERADGIDIYKRFLDKLDQQKALEGGDSEQCPQQLQPQ